MPHTRTPSPFAAYDASRRRDRIRALFARITAKDILLAILAILAGLGFSITTPGKRIDGLSLVTTARFDTTTRALRDVERRAASLEEHQRFNDYLLCVIVRKVDPTATAPDCAPIIERNSRRVK